MGLLSILDMHILVDQAINEMSIFANSDLETEEIDIQLNRAMYKVMDSILREDVRRELRKSGFEVDQLTLDALRNVKVKQYPIIDDQLDDNKGELPIDYYHKIDAEVKFDYQCNSTTITKQSEIRIHSSEEVKSLIKHPFAKSTKDSVLGEISGNSLYVYLPDNVQGIISGIYLDYIRKPKAMKFAKDNNGNHDSVNSIDCELGDNTHYLIVDVAVSYLSKVNDLSQNKINNLEREKLI